MIIDYVHCNVSPSPDIRPFTLCNLFAQRLPTHVRSLTHGTGKYVYEYLIFALVENRDTVCMCVSKITSVHATPVKATNSNFVERNNFCFP